MTAKMIVLSTINPNAEDKAAEYSQSAKALLAEHGGSPIARYKIDQVLVGDSNLQTVLVVEFDSTDRIRSFVESEAYQALVPIRNEAFLDISILTVE